MKTVEGVCKELSTTDGVIGAFVLKDALCLATSLPPRYDSKRLIQVGATIARINQFSDKAGYNNSAMAFHWQLASLFTWPVGADGLLGVLTAPTAVREAVNLSASIAVEELGRALGGQEPIVAESSAAPATYVPIAHESELNLRMREIERLVVEELGPGGKSLFERCKNKTPRGSASASAWLLAFRNTIVADVSDPGARVTIAMSHYWAPIE